MPRIGSGAPIVEAAGPATGSGKTRGIMDDKGITIPVLLDSRQYSREVLGTMYTPTTYVIDGEGRVRCRLVGHSEDFNGIITDVLSRI